MLKCQCFNVDIEMKVFKALVLKRTFRYLFDSKMLRLFDKILNCAVFDDINIKVQKVFAILYCTVQIIFSLCKIGWRIWWRNLNGNHFADSDNNNLFN